MRSLIRAVGELVAHGSVADSRVPLCNIEDRRLVAHGLLADVLTHDTRQRVAISVRTRHIHLGEAGAHARWQVALADIRRWIHTRKQAELRMAWHRCEVAAFGEHDAAMARLQQRREAIERLGRREVDFIEQDPVSLAHSAHKGPFHERKGKVAALPGRKHGRKRRDALEQIAP